ncbi:hypothetical protein ACIRRA_05785 [Nocardia sp. NPDC101769]|uniref:hypothetical protein n=1 Tax=Nocardia sp. NPDC101769 TaxID=3364333 RepID=UPI0037F35102
MSPAIEQLETLAEIRKLAHLLYVSPERLAYLNAVPDTELREVRDRIARTLVVANHARVEQFALGAAVAPTGVMTRTVSWTDSPLFAARVAGAIGTGKALRVAAELPPYFLAASAAYLSADQRATLIGGLQPTVIRRVAAELARCEDWVTLANTVVAVPVEVLPQIISDLDDVALLESSFLMDPEVRRHVVRQSPLDRIPGVIRLAVERENWQQFQALAGCMTPEQSEAAVEAVGRLADPSAHGRLLRIIRTNSTDTQ